jgi:hypothetical protein
MPSVKIRLSIALGSLLVLGLAAVSTGAALEESEVQFSVDPGQREAGTAQCKGGREVVSGGFFGSVEGEQRAVPQASALTIAPGKPKRWDTVAENAGTAAASVAGYAYCTKRPILDVARTNGATADPGLIGTTTMSCRPERGELVYGGGFENQSGEVAMPLVSKKSGKFGWRASLENPGAEPIGFTAEVLCDVRKRPVKTRKDTVVIDPALSGEATAECKPKEKLLSGGFENELAEPNDGSFTFASRRTGKRAWTVSSVAGTGQVALTAYAYCSPRR